MNESLTGDRHAELVAIGEVERAPASGLVGRCSNMTSLPGFSRGAQAPLVHTPLQGSGAGFGPVAIAVTALQLCSGSSSLPGTPRWWSAQ